MTLRDIKWIINGPQQLNTRCFVAVEVMVVKFSKLALAEGFSLEPYVLGQKWGRKIVMGLKIRDVHTKSV
jgi:hypothetical protein